MARLPLVDPDDPDADPLARDLLQQSRRRNARVPDLPWQDVNVLRAMANHPQLLEAFNAISRVAYNANSLTPQQRELAWLATSYENRCHY